ncbi:MAG: hypothetical protein CMN47_02510 [SAR116 cluster bacterium]|mgnify:FL=1|jgi:CRP-like cAMP-binding protein|nr:hypothetical protein [SAR116 cluster bacterium]|tara:strand:- start:3 stop:506 length:504 start_codon:yes stop_codon:yes gene_type:complete
MIEKDGACIWTPNEVVYSAGEISTEAFLVVDGSVKIFSVDNLLLNMLGPDEIFGETSLILDECRSVNAVAGPTGLSARKVPKTYITSMIKADPVLGALLRKTQHRLIDSNRQSVELAKELDKVFGQLESHFAVLDKDTNYHDDVLQRMREVKRKVDRFKKNNPAGYR